MSRAAARSLSFACAMLAAGTLSLTGAASARGIRVDVGSFNYDFNGQAWESSETALGVQPFVAGTLPFAIDIDGTLQSSFCLFGNGSIGFALDCTAVPADAFLQPLLSDWIVGDADADRIFESGSVTYTEGHLARGTFPPDPLDAPAAVRFHWNDLTCAACGGFTYSFQAILIDQGGGDFDLEFNFNDIPAGIGVSRILLGSSSFQSAGPFFAATDYDFSFRDGVLVTDGQPVPEPGTLGLLLAAGLVFATLRRRRA
jgi:hypothetical protein